jgi:hypothetical protein
MHAHPIAEGDLDEDLRRLIAGAAKNAPTAAPLAYPAARRWIMDEVGMWLTLGRLPGLRHGFLSPEHALQSGEFMQKPYTEDWILCHYYSNTMWPFFGWIEEFNRRLHENEGDDSRPS